MGSFFLKASSIARSIAIALLNVRSGVVGSSGSGLSVKTPPSHHGAFSRCRRNRPSAFSIPLVSVAAANTMPDKASVVARLKENPAYVAAFSELLGKNSLDDAEQGYAAMARAIAATATMMLGTIARINPPRRTNERCGP